jgi:peptidyl-tRNA hydrolase, PTH1 family
MDALSEKKWLVVGLGNPGSRYEKTRHNLGFMLIDKLAQKLQTQVRREECRALIGRGAIENQPVELAKPQTFMNLSGEAVSCLVRKSDRSIEKMIVVSDDLALPFGKIRLRPKGTHGGQNGLRSIIDCLRTQDFIRLRIGIQPEHPVASASSFVLENFSKNDLTEVENILDTSVEAIFAVVKNGVEKAMAQYN